MSIEENVATMAAVVGVLNERLLNTNSELRESAKQNADLLQLCNKILSNLLLVMQHIEEHRKDSGRSSTVIEKIDGKLIEMREEKHKTIFDMKNIGDEIKALVESVLNHVKPAEGANQKEDAAKTLAGMPLWVKIMFMVMALGMSGWKGVELLLKAFGGVP